MTEIRELQGTSYEEFEAMEKQENLTYEFIDGMVMMSPRPALKHQRINGRLYVALSAALAGKNCEPLQEADLILEKQNLVPDLMVICDEDLDEMKYYDKPPLIVVEIISPSSGSRDYFVKRRAYKELGVQEYWIVSPEESCIMVICFATDEECRYCQGQMHSFLMPEIIIDLQDIFAPSPIKPSAAK